MIESLIQQLEDYRHAHGLTYAQLAVRLEIPETYLYRWKKKNSINGIYAKLIRLFLKQVEVTV